MVRSMSHDEHVHDGSPHRFPTAPHDLADVCSTPCLGRRSLAVRQSQATLTGGVQLDTDDDLAPVPSTRTHLRWCFRPISFFPYKGSLHAGWGPRPNVNEVVRRDTQIKNESGLFRREQKR